MKTVYTSFALFILLWATSCNNSEEITPTSEFVKYFVEGVAVDMVQTGDNGFAMVLTGKTDNSFLIKTSTIGIQEWRNEIADFHVKDVLNSSSDNEFVVLGDFDNFGADDISIRIIDLGGEIAAFHPDLSSIAQSRGVSDMIALQMTIDLDGSLIVVGESNDQNGLLKPFIFKVEGNVIKWIYELGKNDPGAHVHFAPSLLIDNSEVIVAYTINDALGEDAFVRVVSINQVTGAETNLSTITDFGDLIVNEMISTPSGFAFLGSRAFFSGSSQLSITLLDGNAQVIDKPVNIISSSIGSAIANTSDGGFIIAGSIREFNDNDFLLLKTDQAGIPTWEDPRVMGGESGDDISVKVLEVEDGGGYVLFGTSWIKNAKARPTLIKTNKYGLLYK